MIEQTTEQLEYVTNYRVADHQSIVRSLVGYLFLIIETRRLAINNSDK